MIKSNAPKEYVCPICLGVKGVESPNTLMKPSGTVYKDDLVTAFINSFFVGKNAGHVIVVPNEHFESIYDLPQRYGQRVFDVAQKMAYGYDGITARQNNEPAGDQHAFHYHFHIFPRYEDDDFNSQQPADKRLAEPAERAKYTGRLKQALK